MLITNLINTGYGFGEKTFYSDAHLGQDKRADKTPLEFPVDLFKCTYSDGKQGGLTVTGQDKLGYIHRFMHNSSFRTLDSTILKGTTFAISGNTGSFSTNPHVHWDIRKPTKTGLKFINFINPLAWQKEILPNLNNMKPQWIIDNKTDVWAKEKMIRIEQDNLTLTEWKELESLKKATQPADIIVNVFGNLSSNELPAYNLAVRDTNRFYGAYTNLIFQKPEKLNVELVLTKNKLNFTPKKGLNIIIVEDADLILGRTVNGFAVIDQNILVVERKLLREKDNRDRGHVNGFACTLQHELSHWFGTKLDFTSLPREDRTHYYDYEFTLSNYLPKLAWGLLHDNNFRINSGL